MASHPSPFHRQRQSNKTLDPTGQTAKFLYTILKQLDLKNIDWNQIATELDITNGHAARMRWSRFRAQIEGLDNSYSRRGGRKKDGDRKRKKESHDRRDIHVDDWNGEAKDMKRLKMEVDLNMKMEEMTALESENSLRAFETVKDEPLESLSVIDGVNVHHPTMTTISIPEPPTSLQSLANQHNSVSQPLPTGQRNSSKLATMPRPTSSSHGYLASQAPPFWHHQNFNSGHNYHYHQSSASPLMYYNTPGSYNNQYRYPNFYPTQFQPRVGYVQQPFYGQSNTTAASVRGDSNTSLQVNRPPALGQTTSDMQIQAQYTTVSNMANTDLHVSEDSASDPSSLRSMTKSKASEQQQAFEMATQASYPWPYSEASLAQFLQQAPNLDGTDLTLVGHNNSSTPNMQQDHLATMTSGLDFTMPSEIEHNNKGNGDVIGQQEIEKDNKEIEGVGQGEGNANIFAITRTASLVDVGKGENDAVTPIKIEP